MKAQTVPSQRSECARPRAGESAGHSLRLFVIVGLGAVLSLAGIGAAGAATAPPLGTTAPFAVVASTFSNTNAATVVNGNICFTTPPGTGFTLNGTQTVPCSAQVGSDQAAATTSINGQACTSLGPAPVTLDTVVVGMNPAGTIPPGCYFSTGALNITTLATVTLSGTGVYIFRSTGALGIGASSTVNVTNGADASNVYWAPVAATTFGASASMVGTIIDPAGITFGHLSSLQGRALVFGGTINADANTITVPAVGPVFIPNPGTVPTLSQGAMILLVGLLAIAGVAAMRARADPRRPSRTRSPRE
jgi:hypothetical protein